MCNTFCGLSVTCLNHHHRHHHDVYIVSQDNIGLAALLETRAAAWEGGGASDAAPPNQRLLVCTAHIHWDPEFCDVKLIQTMMLMHEVCDASGMGRVRGMEWLMEWDGTKQ